MSTPLAVALSEAELELLAAFLAANPHADGLTLEGVDGLFCALIASPTFIPPSAYWPAIVGEPPDDPDLFETPEQITDTMALLMRYWNAIITDFREGDRVHFPYLEDTGLEDIPGRAWARGFLRGTRLAPAGWDRFFQDEKEGMALAIPLVAGEMDPAWPTRPLTREKSDELLQWMFASAARAYRYFETDRYAATVVDDPTEAPYVRSDPKVGRNDPCPCGSGKKFKKCCGAPHRDTLQ